ncbi:MAG TPA: hypothetical protein VNL71_14135 [Chloroflexota bacterium]|nr:hypothetical protein [Chloroflexota bacterium]
MDSGCRSTLAGNGESGCLPVRWWRAARWGLLALALLAGSVPARAGGGSGYGLSAIQPLVLTGNPTLDLAQRYALAVLGTDFTGETHVAAAGYYTNPWIRDSFAWGMIPSRAGNSLASYSGQELQYWLTRQQPFGGWLTAPKSGYFDETPILIGAALDAYRVSGDLDGLRLALPRLERGWRWLKDGFIRPSKGSSVLIYANVPPHTAADWADQVARRGYATQLEALWYSATLSLSVSESVVHHPSQARYFSGFAARIKADINRLLWTTGAPTARNAPPVPAFGHYRSWVGPRDYFELDSNFLCIVYGIASPAQATSIDDFVMAHGTYLLGLGSGEGVPARVLYGDYDPRDYAGKHSRLGPGRYQSAYWPTVGALVALGYARSGRVAEARAILLRLAQAFVEGGDIREWYAGNGQGNGAPAFGWAARMFLVALYAAYLGVEWYDAEPGTRAAPGIALEDPAGQGEAALSYHGRVLRLRVRGQGATVRVAIGSRIARTSLLPGPLLCEGCTVSVNWTG